MDFDERPFIAIWETTQACDLACKHCRASARPERDHRELDTEEGKELLSRLRAGRVPLVVLTGGDPAKRPDLVELVKFATDIGLHIALTPSTTPRVTTPLLTELARAGLKRLAVSIDGAAAPVHDAFRGVSGSFDDSLRILDAARTLGISRQVNTTVHSGTAANLPEMATLVASTGAALWSVFFVVPTGRATPDMLASAAEVEHQLEQLAEIARTAPFSIKTTAAPHYRRVLAQRRDREAPGRAPPHARVRVNDGRGFVFISHRGDLFPSGFLPIPCGNVRQSDVMRTYRDHALFQLLRDPDRLEGKCGACSFRAVCGGSRARAYWMTGSALGPDPLCAYVPPGFEARQPARRRHLEVLRG